jgi:hypothetical protein
VNIQRAFYAGVPEAVEDVEIADGADDAAATDDE